ncbi:hypothetical protein [Streptomyces sp. NPDC127098]|uniref:hypothetical protein n=1 Tax=Streptomyces sp. NPDC127098 TaxID=3347137 RepID=UPI00364A156C
MLVAGGADRMWPSPRFAHGGTAHADAALGAAVWPHVLAAVRGDRTPSSAS